MNVLALIPSDLDEPTTRFRIVQYEALLKSEAVEIDYVSRDSITSDLLDRIGDVDVIFNNRCLFRIGLAKKILKSGKRTIFDFDDAVYTRPGKRHSFLTSARVKSRFHLWLEYADAVSSSNNFLADYARNYRSHVNVLPMALDLDLWKPDENGHGKNETVTIGWIGSPVNIPRIESLDEILCSLLERYSFLKLAVLCGKKPLLKCPFEYYNFMSKDEYNFVKKLDIGLLPLVHEEYMMGKSPIKAIQYLACGVPVVGNVFGGTAEILNPRNSLNAANNDEWFKGLELLAVDEAKRRTLGENGRKFVLKHHDLKTAAKQFLNILKG